MFTMKNARYYSSREDFGQKKVQCSKHTLGRRKKLKHQENIKRLLKKVSMYGI